MHKRFSAIPVIIMCCASLPAVAGYKDDIGFTRLLQEQGVATPDGAGVKVAQVETKTSKSAYMPGNNTEFSGKTLTNAVMKETDRSSAISTHATSVGKTFYGNSSSIAPAITLVNAYAANTWPLFDYLLFGFSGNPQPRISADRVANHSWIGSFNNSVYDSAVLRRTDWVVDTDEFIQCVGQTNSSTLNDSLLSGAYNVIAVGKSDGNNGYGTRPLDADYVSGRVRPELVAPKSSSSGAAPVIAAAAALLVDLGSNNPGLSIDSVEQKTTNRNGTTIYNAERSEVIKAVLMAGADRVTRNTNSVDILDYRAAANQTANGLDDRYGAGQVNIYNSYHIVAATEQGSDEDDGVGSGLVGLSGFDYDPSFGGIGGSNSTATYRFSTGTDPVVFAATLAWNMKITWGNSSSLSGSATLHNLDLALYDVTGGGQVLQGSASTIDNTETIWTALAANRDYRLEVSRQGTGTFDWDFALAWHSQVDTDTDTVPDIFDDLPNDPAESLDTDGDGIGNNADPDDDNDGLLDIDEATYGADPLIADTDGDGFADGMEVDYGSDPSVDSSTPVDNVTNNGDINVDGAVDVADVLLATRIMMGLLGPTADQLVRADMVPDGQITAGDVVRIQQLVLGL